MRTLKIDCSDKEFVSFGYYHGTLSTSLFVDTPLENDTKITVRLVENTTLVQIKVNGSTLASISGIEEVKIDGELDKRVEVIN